MADNPLVVLRDEDQEPEYVVLFYNGETPLRVHILRSDINDFEGWQLQPSLQNLVIRTNLESLRNIVEGRIARTEYNGTWTIGAGRPLTLIQLTRAELEGLQRLQEARDVPTGSPAAAGTAIDDATSAPEPAQLSGVGGRASQVTSRTRLTAPPTTIPTLSQQDRAEILGRLDALDAGFQALRSLVEQAEHALTDDYRGIGDNRPPEPIDAPPLSVDDILLGAAAEASMRIELAVEKPRADVWRTCAHAFRLIANRIPALIQWASNSLMVTAATVTILQAYHVDLVALTNKLFHLL